MTRSPPWNETENWACCSLYAAMHQRAHNDMPYNKAAMIREAQGTDEAPGALHARSRGSIERKLMNLTAIIEEFGLPHRSMASYGYVPFGNYQADLKATAQKYWDHAIKNEVAA